MAERQMIVSRVVRLTAPAGPVAERLSAAPGIAGAQGHGERLELRYDLLRLRFDEVLRLIEAAGGIPAGGPLIRLRRGWVRFREANLVDQAHLVHQCCSKPMAGRR